MRDLYFNPNYAKVYKDIDGSSDTFVFECQYGKITNTYIKRKVCWQIEGITYYDIVTPYGYGGPLAENVSDVKKLLIEYKKAFTEYCKEHNIICEFIRFHLYENVDIRENYYGETQHILDNVVVSTKNDFENDIWMSYAHKVRKNVKKALKNDLSVIIENNLNHIDDFLYIYNLTMDRNNANDYYYFKDSYFKSIAELLPDNYMYFHVIKDGKICSTELVLCSEKYAYSFLGGTLTEYYEFRPNDYLKNEIIKWCNKTGREYFILGGGYHKDDGIYRYKKGFTSDPDVPFYIGKYIFDEQIYNKIVEVRKSVDNSFNIDTNYFPKYRS
ncbi:MAG: GNAT family N-acetyltransferase [Lentimicrobiaceae bacterium]|nr:GNAT family N-acetyltransferase [Lentimicrobiaceae bacterium]